MPGKIMCLTGSNGAGKSTLLAGIMGISDLWVTGTIMWKDSAIHDLPVHERARKGFLYIAQHSLEIPGLPADVLMTHALRAQGRQVDPDWVHAQVVNAYQRVGLSYQSCARGLHQGLSGGQKRRAELAQILVLQPRVILLDEVDAHLDLEGKVLIAQLLSEYIEQHADTVVMMATHSRELMDLLVAHGLSICVQVVEDGKVRAA